MSFLQSCRKTIEIDAHRLQLPSRPGLAVPWKARTVHLGVPHVVSVCVVTVTRTVGFSGRAVRLLRLQISCTHDFKGPINSLERINNVKVQELIVLMDVREKLE